MQSSTPDTALSLGTTFLGVATSRAQETALFFAGHPIPSGDQPRQREAFALPPRLLITPALPGAEGSAAPGQGRDTPDAAPGEEVIDYLREQVAPFQVPNLVEFFPLPACSPANATGKVLKTELRQGK